jgi:DNA ligase-4
MIVFFDILLLDDDICLSKPHRLRRLLLKETVKITPGRAEISEQEIIDFSRPDAIRRLQLALSRSIAERWEGYVIKACDEPYFSVLSSERSDGFSRWIKLKKDYIPGLGDTADFSLIGARYDAKDGPSLSSRCQLSWTHFFIGCLDNKEDVVRLSVSPRFRIVDMIGTHSLSVNDMLVINQWGNFVACDVDSNTAFECYSIHNSLPSMDVAFKIPFVVELLGSGFDKPSNAQYYTLRFPRVLKIHWDRSFEDAISFVELQDLAEKARAVPADELEEENAVWLEKVAGTNRKKEYIVDKSQSTSTSSFTCTSPLSKSASLISPGLTPPSVKQAPVSLIRDRRPFSQSPTTSSLNKRRRTISLVYPPPTLDSALNLETTSSNLNFTSSILNFTSSNLAPASCLKRLKISAPTSSTIMEHSATMDLDQAPEQSLRARGSPIQRAWASSVGSPDSPSTESSFEPKQTSSGLGSGFTTPLRGNSTVPSNEIPSRAAAASLEEALRFIEEAEAEVEANAGPCHVPSPEYEPANLEVFLGPTRDTDVRVLTGPLKIHPISPLSTVPIYCGESGFLEDTFRKAPREFTFSAKHFVKSLGFPYTRRTLRLSNPAAVKKDMALGIVLVDIKDPSTVLAMQLYDMGNLLASELSQPNPELQPQGKIFFLDSRILKAGGQAGINNKMFLLTDWWSEYGIHYFYASISWRSGSDASPFVSGPRRVIDQINDHGTRATSSGGRAAANIINVYEPSDVEILGEFVSVDPTVHLLGERYYAPIPPAPDVPATYDELVGPLPVSFRGPLPIYDDPVDALANRYSSSAFV